MTVWTRANPQPISTASEFNTIVRSEPNGYYYLTNCIDLQEIGAYWAHFNFGGFLDGRGHSIIGLQINSYQGGGGVGLFGRLNSATVCRLHIELGSAGINVGNSTIYKAALSGNNYGFCQVFRVSATFLGAGYINSNGDRAGQLVGYSDNNDSIVECWTSIRITGGGTRLGGIIAYNSGAELLRSYYDNTWVTDGAGTAESQATLQSESFWAVYNNSASANQQYWEVATGSFPKHTIVSSANATYITSAQQLTDIRSNPGGYYILTKDIDVSTWAPWETIDWFEGHLDGAGNVIRGLQVTSSNGYASTRGLFGYTVVGARVTNLGIESCYFYDDDAGANHWGGPVIAVARRAFVDNCFVRNSLIVKTSASSGRVGGILGYMDRGGEIANCYGTSVYSGTNGQYDGGLVGYMRAENAYYKAYEQNNAFDYDNWGTSTPGLLMTAFAGNTSSLQISSTFAANSWDYASTWNQTSGEYPQLNLYSFHDNVSDLLLEDGSSRLTLADGLFYINLETVTSQYVTREKPNTQGRKFPTSLTIREFPTW